MKHRVYYTIYLNSSDEIVAFGTSKECAEQLGTSISGIYNIACKTRKGVLKKYTVIKDLVVKDESSDQE